RRLARELYLGQGPQQAGGPYGLRGCSVADCPAGTICDVCGPGEPECMELPAPVGGFDGFCVGPVLTCEYAPDYDAGPPPLVDAGSSPDADSTQDAGDDPPRELDAGQSPSDDDAGGEDNGDDDDGFPERPQGPTVTADGCACSSSRT